MSEYHYYKLHNMGNNYGPGQFVVKGYGEYEASSVLAGQTRIVFLDAFDTEAQAREAYPQLPGDGTEWGNKFFDRDLCRMPDTAPDWFDPADAGERWDDEY